MAKDLEKRAELVEHLSELRTRIVRSLVYLVLGVVVAWLFYNQVFQLLVRPMRLAQSDLKLMFTGFPEAFVIRMQICLVAGLIIMAPLVTMEMWGFVAPGLTKSERRAVRLIGPLSAVLFILGVALCYSILPAAFKWFMSYVPKNAEFRPMVLPNVLFTVKMLLAFGLCFEMPVVLMLLAKIGIVDSRMLIGNWRSAVVLVCIVAAVATPSNDAFTMLMMAAPMVVLFFASIGLVRMVEGKRRFD